MTLPEPLQQLFQNGSSTVYPERPRPQTSFSVSVTMGCAEAFPWIARQPTCELCIRR